MLLLSAALIAPYFIDWTKYRAEFEAEATNILGRSVSVRGPVSVRLLPFPSVTFSDVEVAGNTQNRPAMKVETFSLDAELAPLMSGNFRIFDMRLVNPRMFVSVDEQGVVDWTVRLKTFLDPGQISVEKLTVTGGEIRLDHGPGGRSHVISNIDADLTAKTLKGPWRVNGQLLLDGLRSGFEIATGEPDPIDGAIRLRLKIMPNDYPLLVETDGSLRVKEGKPAYAGNLQLAVTQTEKLELRDGEGKNITIDEGGKGKNIGSYRVSGPFLLENDRLELTEYRFETGPADAPYKADGSAIINFGKEPHFEVKASGAQVHFDETIAADEGHSLNLETRIAALEKALLSLPRPTIPGRLDIDLPAILAGDTTIRDVRVVAEPVRDGWNISQFASSLPGRTRLEASGILKVTDEVSFSGNMLLAVGQPSGFAAWLSREVDDTIRKLPAAGFDAKVEMTRSVQRFDDLELRLGDGRLEGTIERLQRGNIRPSINVDLRGDAVDMEALSAFASIFIDPQGESRFAETDLDLNMKAGPVHAAGLTADMLDMSMRFRDQRLELDRFTIDGLEGTNITATGRFEKLGERRTGSLDASLLSSDLGPLIDNLAQQMPDNPILVGLKERVDLAPSLFKDARFDLIANSVTSSKRGIAMSGTGTFGGSDVQFTASGSDLDQDFHQLPLSLTLAMTVPDGTNILSLAGLETVPLDVLGKVSADLTLDGTLENGLRTAFSLRGDELDGGFDGMISFAGEHPFLQGEARLSSEDIEPWMIVSGYSMPGVGTGMPVGLSSSMRMQDGVLSSTIEGSISQQPVEAQLKASLRETVPHLEGSISLSALDLKEFAGMVFGQAALEASSTGKWSEAAFPASVILPFTLDLVVEAGEAMIGQGIAASATKFGFKLSEEGLRVNDFAGDYAGGRLTGFVSLLNNGGTGLFSSSFNLAHLNLAEMPGLPNLSGRMDFSGSADSTGKSFEGLISGLSGSGTVLVKDIKLKYLDGGALPALIEVADGIGPTLTEKQVAEFAPSLLMQGEFAGGDGEAAFSITSGNLRVPQLRLQNDQAILTTDLNFQLASDRLQGRSQLAFNAGDDAMVGSEPSVALDISGGMDAPIINVDTDLLAQFLTQRALEKEQERVEAMQSELLEEQRLRREIRYFQSRELDRERAKAEALDQQEAQRKLDIEAERLKQVERERLAADEQRRLDEEAEKLRRKAEEEHQRKVKADAAAAAKAAERPTVPAMPQLKIPSFEIPGLPGVKTPALDLPRGDQNAVPQHPAPAKHAPPVPIPLPNQPGRDLLPDFDTNPG